MSLFRRKIVNLIIVFLRHTIIFWSVIFRVLLLGPQIECCGKIIWKRNILFLSKGDWTRNLVAYQTCAFTIGANSSPTVKTYKRKICFHRRLTPLALDKMHLFVVLIFVFVYVRHLSVMMLKSKTVQCYAAMLTTNTICWFSWQTTIVKYILRPPPPR